MKTCILHIGMHKTGTSSIQRYLDTHKEELGNKIKFASFGMSNHSGPINFLFKRDLNQSPLIRQQHLSQRDIRNRVKLYQQYFDQSMQADFRQIIISAEAIVELNEHELSHLKERLLSHVDKIILIAYIRPPIDFMESAIQQGLKMHQVHLDYNFLYPRYQTRFEKFEHVFDPVEYRLFSKSSLFQGDVVADFCQRFSINHFPYHRENESLSALAVKFLYHFQKYRLSDKISNQDVVLIEETLSQLDAAKFCLPTQIIDETFEHFSQDIKWIENRLGLSGEFSHISKIDREDDLSSLNKISENERQQLLELAKNKAFSEYVSRECGMTLASFIATYFK